MKYEIEYDIRTGRVILHAPYSQCEFTAATADKLFAVLRVIAEAEAQPSVVERAVAQYDLKEMLRAMTERTSSQSREWATSGCGQMRVKRFSEKGKLELTLEDIGL